MFAKKIDLVMWTRNSAKTLPFTLQSIERAIPKANVGQKIIVDGHSTDATKSIGEKFGWNVISAETVGIPYQANQALDLVKTELFASFEHDIILKPNWFSEILKHFQSDPKVAVAQGVRLSTNPVIRTIEQDSLKKDVRHISIDNNIYRTDVIKNLGGYDTEFSLCCDRNLHDRVLSAGYKWIIDKTVVSDHMRGGIRQTASHAFKLAIAPDYPSQYSISSTLSRILFSPIRGIDIAVKKECPQAMIAYPYWRLMLLKAALKIRAKQKAEQS